MWDVDQNKLHQLISDQLGRWGQVTTIAWLSGFYTGRETVCFGTGHGFLLLYRQKKNEVRISYVEKLRLCSDLRKGEIP